MLHLVIYDISSNSIRTKVAKLLIREGFERLQLSVYLGIDNPNDLPQIWAQLQMLLKKEIEAKFYIFPIPKSSLSNIKSIGELGLDIDYLLGNKNSFLI